MLLLIGVLVIKVLSDRLMKPNNPDMSNFFQAVSLWVSYAESDASSINLKEIIVLGNNRS